jgi:hypothetical protein
MSANQIVFLMAEEERQALLRTSALVQDAAGKYADECVRILVEEHGAQQDRIKRDNVFYYAAITRCIEGRLGTPAEGVAEALRLMKPSVLGLPDDYGPPRRIQ